MSGFSLDDSVVVWLACRRANASVLFVEAPGTPVFSWNPHEARVWRAARRNHSYVCASTGCAAPFGAPPAAFFSPRGRASGCGTGDLPLLPADFRPPSSAPASSHSRQSPVVGPDGYPRPPECGVTSPARRRRAADAGLVRYRPIQGGSIIETSRDDALNRARQMDYKHSYRIVVKRNFSSTLRRARLASAARTAANRGLK